jgi:hypothetical protein
MHTGQLNLSGPFNAVDPRATPNSAADVESEATFARLFETALELSDMDCSATGASDNPFDMESNAAGLLTKFDSGALVRSSTSPSFSQIVTNSKLNDPQSTKALQVQQIECPAQAVSGSLASQPGVAGAIDKNELSNWMDAHALTRSSHRCAMYCRMGMEAAGLSTADRPQSGDAGDYGPYLLRHGAQTVPQDSYIPQVGDVVVFDKTSQHPFGHIQTYDGHHWVSDFVQHGLSPYSDASSAPAYTIYRFA